MNIVGRIEIAGSKHGVSFTKAHCKVWSIKFLRALFRRDKRANIIRWPFVIEGNLAFSHTSKTNNAAPFY